jgi:predicted transcriptional regulator
MPARAAKISITVDASLLRDVKKVARRSGRSLSAHVTEALARDLRRVRLQELVAEHEENHGEITDDELKNVRTKWQD